MQKFARAFKLDDAKKVVHVPVPTNDAFSSELLKKLKYGGDRPNGGF